MICCRPEGEFGAGEERPDFLPMFPWYTGTSADMYLTIFGLIVSLKLFLGRFDMRTMQARPSTLFSLHKDCDDAHGRRSASVLQFICSPTLLCVHIREVHRVLALCP